MIKFLIYNLEKQINLLTKLIDIFKILKRLYKL